jgi:hypothetical protein
MIRTKRLIAIAALVTICIQGTVRAAITQSNIASLPSPDGLNITSDSLTGLDWLDPAVTSFYTVPEVTARFSSDLAGFHYATYDEVKTFFSHLPVPLPATDLVFVLDGGASYMSASSYFGTTYSLGNQAGTQGYITDPRQEPQTRYLVVAQMIQGAAGLGSKVFPAVSEDSFGNNGSWLIRSVPEPATFFMALIGAIVAFPARRRR